MFEHLPYEVSKKIFGLFNNNKKYILNRQLTKQQTFDACAMLIEDIAEQLNSKVYGEIIKNLNSIHKRIVEKRADNAINDLSKIKKYVMDIKIELQTTLNNVKIEDLEKIIIDIGKFPIELRHFVTRLVCNKKIDSNRNAQNSDQLIHGLIRLCLQYEDLAKADELANLVQKIDYELDFLRKDMIMLCLKYKDINKAGEIANKMQDREYGIIFIIVHTAKTKPTQAFTQIRALQNKSHKEWAFKEFIRICEENNHIESLEAIYNGQSTLSLLDATNDYYYMLLSPEMSLEAAIPLASCYLRKNDIISALRIAKGVLAWADKEEYKVTIYGYGDINLAEKTKKLDKRRTLESTANQIFKMIGEYYITNKYYTEILEIAPQMRCEMRGDKYYYPGDALLIAAIPESIGNSYLERDPSWFLNNFFSKINDEKNRQQALFKIIKLAIANEEIDFAQSIAQSIQDNLSSSSAYELLVNYFLEKKDMQSAQMYLSQIQDGTIRARNLSKMAQTPAVHNLRLI